VSPNPFGTSFELRQYISKFEEISMNKLLIKALTFSLFAVLATATAASAQLAGGGSIEANIPFRFYASDTWLPAGKYTITRPDTEEPDVLLLRNADDTVEVFLVTSSATRPQAPSNEGALDFDRIGNKEFLSAVWTEGSAVGYQLEEPRLEKKLEKAAMNKEKHTLKAHHTKS
jgi:hypothetical protein